MMNIIKKRNLISDLIVIYTGYLSYNHILDSELIVI